MKRNVDIVRDVLVAASHQDEYEPRTQLAAQHAVLLIDLGYLAGSYVQENEGRLSYIEVVGLTGKGRTLLEAVRDEAVWRKTKHRMGDSLDRAPLEKIRMAAEEVVGQHSRNRY